MADKWDLLEINAVARKCYDERSVFFTGRLKSFPAAGTWELMAASRPIFRRPGFEPVREPRYQGGASRPERSEGEQDGASRPERSEGKQGGDPERVKANVARAVRRAKIALRDYALSTEMTYFVTLTLDQTKIDRYDVDRIVCKMSQWCSNQVKRRGLAYILVPERHKDGAIHFHGFFNGALEAVDSGTVIPPEGGKPRRPKDAAQRAAWLNNGGHVVYNLPAWTWGYTTAIELYGDYARAVGYVVKYVGKQIGADGLLCKIGGRWYYSGGALRQPDVIYTKDLAAEVAERPGAYVFDVPEALCTFAKEHGNY